MTAPFDFQALANPDARLFEAIRHKEDVRRAYGQARAADFQRLAEEGEAAQAVIAAHRPETLDGLLTKLRWAARRMHRAPAFEAQYTALLDAIAWLEPVKPGRRRRAKRGAP